MTEPAMDGAAIDRAMVRSAVPAARRSGWDAVLALDARLGDVVRTTREPMVGQMRLAWWREALARLAAGPAPAEPVLQALADAVSGYGVGITDLVGQVEGWEELLDGAVLDRPALERFAEARGGRLFTALAAVLEGDGGIVGDAGAGWALADLSRAISDPATAARAAAMARERFAAVWQRRWPRALRPLGALALVAAMDVDGHPAPGSPRRALRLVRHRLTGR